MYSKFWMCLVETMGVPKKTHWTKVKAVQEAERLARKEGKTVYLLEAIETVHIIPPEPPVLWDKTA